MGTVNFEIIRFQRPFDCLIVIQASRLLRLLRLFRVSKFLRMLKMSRFLGITRLLRLLEMTDVWGHIQVWTCRFMRMWLSIRTGLYFTPKIASNILCKLWRACSLLGSVGLTPPSTTLCSSTLHKFSVCSITKLTM